MTKEGIRGYPFMMSRLPIKVTEPILIGDCLYPMCYSQIRPTIISESMIDYNIHTYRVFFMESLEINEVEQLLMSYDLLNKDWDYPYEYMKANYDKEIVSKEFVIWYLTFWCLYKINPNIFNMNGIAEKYLFKNYIKKRNVISFDNKYTLESLISTVLYSYSMIECRNREFANIGFELVDNIDKAISFYGKVPIISKLDITFPNGKYNDMSKYFDMVQRHEGILITPIRDKGMTLQREHIELIKKHPYNVYVDDKAISFEQPLCVIDRRIL